MNIHQRVRGFGRRVFPDALWRRAGSARRRWAARNNADLSVRDVFTRIYDQRLWGDHGSGGGSHFEEISRPYVEAVERWCDDHGAASLSAVDIGCGDFAVGARLFNRFHRYTAIDVVPSLIERLQSESRYAAVRFLCANAVSDPIPTADVAFVRQVFQHLSNEEILAILARLRPFRHAIVTEHLPSPNYLGKKNRDKVHGGDIRLARRSGVYLEAPPFCFQCVESQVLLEVPGGPDRLRHGVIRTTHYRLR